MKVVQRVGRCRPARVVWCLTAANLRNDDSVQRFTNPVGGQPVSIGWIPLGRDVALEQTILGQLQARFGGQAPLIVTPQPVGLARLEAAGTLRVPSAAGGPLWPYRAAG